MPLLWLRVATVFYGIGLLYAVLLLSKRGEWLSRIAVPAVGFGLVFHFVSFVETAYLYGYTELLNIRHAESGLALLILALYMVMFARFKNASPGLFVFPLVFILTFAPAIGQRPIEFPSPTLRNSWIVVHVAALLVGYAALFLSFVASLLYLAQARSLKSKNPSSVVFSRMPGLQVIDELGYRALLLGFPFMTFGLIAGSVVAQSRFGAAYFSDPKVLLSALMWGVYMLLLYTRWNSGWRGRKAAYLATFAFVAAVCAWAANYLSKVHRFIAP